ncbi:MAG: mechanosensitive ion channel, partial [Chloroflexi bacterium]|nr:mechanosensitive ion channel [Chloroflexota bacterium]
MQEFFDSLGPIGSTILTVLAAIGILILGYIIARILARVVRGLLGRTNIDDRFAKALNLQALGVSIEDVITRVVFWIVMLFTAVAILQRVDLPAAATPIQSLLNNITTDYLPRIGGAILLLLVAWGIATVLRMLIVKGAGMLKVDERLTQHAALEEGEEVKVSDSLATAVFWFIFLLFLPAVLQTLGITSIASPLQDMFGQALAYVPNIFAAVITLLIGWFIARILRQIITNLLVAVGTDSFGQRINLSGERSLSWL